MAVLSFVLWIGSCARHTPGRSGQGGNETDLAEIASDEFPGARLVVRRNAAHASERTRKREELLLATEAEMAKHFKLRIEDGTFSFERKHEQIDAEAALDGLYVLRTTCPTTQPATPAVVRA